MKRIYVVLALVFLCSCESDSGNRNPFLQEANFTFDVNLSLPLFSGLNITGNAVFIGNQGVGIRGVYIINTGFGNFLAWEANCPNQTPNSCSTMELVGGTNVMCPCDGFEYSLFNGQLLTQPEDEEQTVFGLLNYATQVRGDIVTISN